MLLRWGENCLFHCILAYRTAQEQHNKHNHHRKRTTQHTVNKKENEAEKKCDLYWGKLTSKEAMDAGKKRNWIREREGGKETRGREDVRENTDGLGLNSASQAWLSLTPLAPHEIIFILYESKGSLVENERLHKPEPKPSEWERRRSPLQGPCCYSKHLPLCGRSSSPIVVQKLVVLPLAPFGSRGMRQTPLLFRVQIHGWMRGPGYHHHWLWPFALSPTAHYRVVFPPPHPLNAVHFSRTLASQHSYSFLHLSFVLLLSFFLWCICLLFFGAPSLYPWLYFKGLSLWFWSHGEWVVGWWEL